ncbi:hypothetical protein SA2016_0091 [Sinomonas atrocyanea]|uniref:YhcG PDDEXK nuclease domain-containing protein n=1 Tax=Sinomonas atrocyanea TaxID=37927 RepID=A0A126ZV64_9MICC|nr:PDDEXK nuclease domain-containing protein [Sinomonas atrocyanea]AMM30796.1 hypothetical protein SA2016_0091 [Sinomonas atrocyanea]GEB63842.1 hypothetical protein SAT01_12900 [Sinomonas atrocyanea]GGG65263.1 hypothetical protein GCM10007172_15930 [Sinomonas atrocyanea]
MPDSDLTRQLAKDPYNLDFLGLTIEAAERELEQALTDHIVGTLRELGSSSSRLASSSPSSPGR